MKHSQIDLAKIRSIVLDLTKVLDMYSVSERSDDRDATFLVPTTTRVTTARAWIKAQTLRRAHLSPTMFHDPAWDLLLHLYVAQAEGKKMWIKAATFAMNIPPTTALRWLERLQQAGWISREIDPDDPHRTIVKLSDHIVQKMNNLLDAAAASDNELGLARMYLVKNI